MAVGLIQRKVDKQVYEFQQFGTVHSLRILTRLTKMIGEPLTIAFSAMGIGNKENQGKGLLDRDMNGKLLGEAVKALMNRLDEDEVLDLIQELSAKDNVLCDGAKIIFNSHYEGKLKHLFKVVAAGLEVQYGDFLGEMFESQGLKVASMSPGKRT